MVVARRGGFRATEAQAIIALRVSRFIDLVSESGLQTVLLVLVVENNKTEDEGEDESIPQRDRVTSDRRSPARAAN